MITELSAEVIEVVEETKVSPKKQLIRKWEEECVEAGSMDAGDVIEAGFEMELSEQQLKLASVKQQLRLEFDSMVLSLEVLTKQLEDAEAKNVKLEATNATLRADLETSESERGCLFTEVGMKNAVFKTLNAEIDSSNVRNKALVVKIDGLNFALAASQSAVTKKKSELKEVRGKLE